MKNLYKKIGVGVLVVGLLAGGGSLSSGVVAHAASGGVSIEQSLLAKAKDSKQKEELKHISDLGYKYKFDVVEVNPNEKFLQSNKSLIEDEIKLSYYSFEGAIKGISESGLYKYSFIRVDVGGLDLILVFY